MLYWSHINKVILMGRVAGDGVLYTTADKKEIFVAVLTTQHFYTDKNGTRHQDYHFHPLILQGQLVEIAKDNIQQGRLLYVEGRLKTRLAKDKKDIYGKRQTDEVRHITSIIVEGHSTFIVVERFKLVSFYKARSFMRKLEGENK